MAIFMKSSGKNIKVISLGSGAFSIDDSGRIVISGLELPTKVKSFSIVLRTGYEFVYDEGGRTSSRSDVLFTLENGICKTRHFSENKINDEYNFDYDVSTDALYLSGKRDDGTVTYSISSYSGTLYGGVIVGA